MRHIARWFRRRRRARIEAIFDLRQPMSVYAPSRLTLEVAWWNLRRRERVAELRKRIAEILDRPEAMVIGDFDSPPP